MYFIFLYLFFLAIAINIIRISNPGVKRIPARRPVNLHTPDNLSSAAIGYGSVKIRGSEKYGTTQSPDRPYRSPKTFRNGAQSDRH